MQTASREFPVAQFGARGDGATDDAPAFQRAIDAACLAGGGVVTVGGSPKGFALRRPLLVRPHVTLQGFRVGPSDGHLLAAADAGAGLPKPAPPKPVPGGLLILQDRHPAITLAHGAAVAGLTAVYPLQTPYRPGPIRPYPPCIQVKGYDHGARVPGIVRQAAFPADGPISGRSVTIRDIGAINAYHIVDLLGDHPVRYQIAQITVDGLWGYPLSVGISIENSLDTVVLRNIQFRPSFFGDACAAISQQAIGFALGKTDGCSISDALVFGLGIGILHKCRPASLGAFSVRISNANIEAMLPVWFDSTAVDDQVQYVNSFLFHTPFAFTRKPDDVYSRESHRLFPDIRFTPADLCVLRVSNTHAAPTFQSYLRVVGCGLHAQSAGPICRIEGNRLVRVMIASSHVVYFRDALLKTAPGALTLATLTGNDVMAYSTNLGKGSAEPPAGELVDLRGADPGSRVIFSNNMVHGLHPAVEAALTGNPAITAQGNVMA